MLTLVLSLAIAAVPLAPASVGGCDDFDAWRGCTSATVDGDDAVLRGDSGAPAGGNGNRGGGTGDSGSASGKGGNGGGRGDADGADAADGGNGGNHCKGEDAASTSECAWNPPRDGYDVVMVTMSDIARFRPSPALQQMQPDGWVVVGLPANIYAVADTQVVAGELLESPAEVRFTPVGYRWDYGDGTSASLRAAGSTWAALGLREFDPTATSHVYRRPGSYTISLSVVYRAEYRIEQGEFVAIAGTLTVPANELRIVAGSAKTVLVDRDCVRNPSGPGC